MYYVMDDNEIVVECSTIEEVARVAQYMEEQGDDSFIIDKPEYSQHVCTFDDYKKQTE